MARKPSVFVWPLSMEEGRKLTRITRTAKNPVRLRRANSTVSPARTELTNRLRPQELPISAGGQVDVAEPPRRRWPAALTAHLDK